MPFVYSPILDDKVRHGDDFPIEDSSSNETLQSPKAASRRLVWYLILALAGFSLLTVFVFTPRPQSQETHRQARASMPCGNSSTEALGNGCIFDIMSFTWSHPQCFDEELMSDFLKYKQWTWWFDAEGEKPVPWSHVSAGHHPQLYVTWEYHLAHCTFMWRKMHRAIAAGKPLDSYVGNIHHTLHCGEMLLDREAALDERNTIIRVKYPSCSLR